MGLLFFTNFLWEDRNVADMKNLLWVRSFIKLDTRNISKTEDLMDFLLAH